MVEEGYGSTKIAQKFNYNASSMQMIIARYKKHGIEGILHKAENKKFTLEEKLVIIDIMQEKVRVH